MYFWISSSSNEVFLSNKRPKLSSGMVGIPLEYSIKWTRLRKSNYTSSLPFPGYILPTFCLYIWFKFVFHFQKQEYQWYKFIWLSCMMYLISYKNNTTCRRDNICLLTAQLLSRRFLCKRYIHFKDFQLKILHEPVYTRKKKKKRD